MNTKYYQKYLDELRKTFPEGLDMYRGQILWGLLTNSKIYTPDGEEVGCSFRGTGKVMAELVGEGEYTDYYMQNNFVKMMFNAVGIDAQKIEDDLQKQLDDAGWKIEEIILGEE